MKCLYPDKPCPYRRWVCRGNDCWWNCGWSCPYNEPMSECEVAQMTWGCLFLCIYDAIADDSICPFKSELKKTLERDLSGVEPPT